jgi:hypothetical protein
MFLKCRRKLSKLLPKHMRNTQIKEIKGRVYGSKGNVHDDEMWGIVRKFLIIGSITYLLMMKFWKYFFHRIRCKIQRLQGPPTARDAEWIMSISCLQ